MKNVSDKMIITQPNVQVKFLTNEMGDRERVEYLSISSEIDVDSLKKAIDLGGEFLENVAEYTKKKNKSRYVFIKCDNKEQGLMAVSYLAAIRNKEEGYFCNNDEFDELYDSDEEDDDLVWEESPYKIPLIDSASLSCLNSDYYDYGFENLNMTREKKLHNSYWMNCKNESVCILFDESEMFYLDVDNNLKLGAEYFSENKTVYIVHSKDYAGIRTKEKEDINLNILRFHMDIVTVEMKQTLQKFYLKNILNETILEKGFVPEKNFNYDTIVDIVINMEDKRKCYMIGLIVDQAIKSIDDQRRKYVKNKDME